MKAFTQREPKRLSDDDDAPPELRALLRTAGRAPPLHPTQKARVGARFARVAALPVAAAGWLTAKAAAAALSVFVGSALVAAIATVALSSPKGGAPQIGSALGAASSGKARPARAPVAAPSVSAAVVDPAKAVSPTGNVGTFPREAGLTHVTAAHAASERANAVAVASTSSLAEESQLLERARSALEHSPNEALRVAREHEQRFPRAQLGAERALIEIDALHRLGRGSEARSLARTLLAQDSGALYVERVQRILGDMQSD